MTCWPAHCAVLLLTAPAASLQVMQWEDSWAAWKQAGCPREPFERRPAAPPEAAGPGAPPEAGLPPPPKKRKLSRRARGGGAAGEARPPACPMPGPRRPASPRAPRPSPQNIVLQ